MANMRADFQIENNVNYKIEKVIGNGRWESFKINDLFFVNNDD